MRGDYEDKVAGVFVIIAMAVWLFVAGCWVVNLVKLVKCDWDEAGSWKGEIVHAIGLIPPAPVVTVWFNDK